MPRSQICAAVICCAVQRQQRLAADRLFHRDKRSDEVVHPAGYRPDVEQRFDPASVPSIVAAQRRIEQHLAGEGRVVLRASGTEPLIRVMVEGRDESEVRSCADDLAQVVRSAVPRKALAT